MIFNPLKLMPESSPKTFFLKKKNFAKLNYILIAKTLVTEDTQKEFVKYGFYTIYAYVNSKLIKKKNLRRRNFQNAH